jgi:hypothetical protein
MRQASCWILCLTWFASGCGSNGVTGTQTGPSQTGASPSPSALTGQLSQPDNGNWLVWAFPQWQPGLGERLLIGATIQSTVEENEICEPTLRSVWDARASCKRFTLTASAGGRLDVHLRWDASAPGYVSTLSGDVVAVAPDGHFADSDWTHEEEHLWVSVRSGEYGLLVMSYVPARLPFQLSTEFRAD